MLAASHEQDVFVLGRIFKKSGPGPKNGEQYGAVFVEEAHMSPEYTEVLEDPPAEGTPAEEPSSLPQYRRGVKEEVVEGGHAQASKSVLNGGEENIHVSHLEMTNGTSYAGFSDDTDFKVWCLMTSMAVVLIKYFTCKSRSEGHEMLVEHLQLAR